jgi:transcriptional regulator with XRE-family HTH domain
VPTRFGTLLSSLRAERGLDVLGLADLCRKSDRVLLKKISSGSILLYEIGARFPHPRRAEVLAQLLESPHLLQIYQEERKPSRAYRYKAELGLIPPYKASEDHCRALSKAGKGRPKSESHRQRISQASKGRLPSEAAVQARTIQDKYTGFGTRGQRYRQRQKHRVLIARLEERARQAALRPVWAPPEGWEPYADTWGPVPAR